MELRLALVATAGLSLLAACAGGPPADTSASARGARRDVRPCNSGSASETLPDGCGLVCRAEIPISFAEGLPFATVWINDQPARLLFDTGASVSSLGVDKAAQLGLGHATPTTGRIVGVGGAQSEAIVSVRHLALGYVSLQSQHMAVVVMGRPAGETPPEGGIGDDILHDYDIDLDLPHGRVTLYQGRPCDGALPGWTHEDGDLPFDPNLRGHHVIVPALLDGHPVTAMVDSGSQTTVVSEPAAGSLGLKQTELTSDLGARMFGVGPNVMPGRLHRFASLQVAGETTHDLESAILPLPFSRPELILGEDYLQTHKVWISYSTGRMHVSHTW